LRGGNLNPHDGEISLDLDLNSKTGEKSPDRGVHAKNIHLTGVPWRDPQVRVGAQVVSAGPCSPTTMTLYKVARGEGTR
jgi:hypothetical protein